MEQVPHAEAGTVYSEADKVHRCKYPSSRDGYGAHHLRKPASSLTIVIVKGNGPTLLGRNWLREIILDWAKIFKVVTPANGHSQELYQILAENAELFDGEPGCLKTDNASLHLKEDARPVFLWPHSLQYATKPEVEAELERLQAQGRERKRKMRKMCSHSLPDLFPAEYDDDLLVTSDRRDTLQSIRTLDYFS